VARLDNVFGGDRDLSITPSHVARMARRQLRRRNLFKPITPRDSPPVEWSKKLYTYARARDEYCASSCRIWTSPRTFNARNYIISIELAPVNVMLGPSIAVAVINTFSQTVFVDFADSRISQSIAFFSRWYRLVIPRRGRLFVNLFYYYILKWNILLKIKGILYEL